MVSGHNQRTVAVVTGTRAEYGLLKSSMEAIVGHEGLSLAVIATGMHLSPRHGLTVDDIRDDGFSVDRTVQMQLDGDTGAAMAKSLGVGILGLTDALDDVTPDIILTLGDRGEALGAAVSAAHMNIPVAHIHGGDAMEGASIDDSIRHALTKFAHIHLPASEQSADRIRKLGEEPWRVTTVGAPGLDDVLREEYVPAEQVFKKYDLDTDRPVILVVQHPVTTYFEKAGHQMAATLDAIEPFDAETVVIYPNSDAGSDQIIAEIESRAEGSDLTTFRSLPRREYLGLMAGVDVMIGNSSSGIIEAPSFDLPVVDIGPRQASRQRAKSTISVPHERDRIRHAVQRGLEEEEIRQQAAACENPYDAGGAGEQVASRLAEIELGNDLLQKQLTF